MKRNEPEIRDSRKNTINELYPLNEIPQNVLLKICGHIVYLIGVGRSDLSGDDFGDAFAKAVDGIHFASPIGIADVARGKMAWSVKTVKVPKPFSAKNIRLISGRNSSDYSYDIDNPRANVDETGEAVLKIWNARVNVAYSQYNQIRNVVLVRSQDLTSFCLFEEEIHQVTPSDYKWSVNDHGNFIGTEKKTGQVKFTWQPSGSQFTIHTSYPANVIKFNLQQPCQLSEEAFLANVNYDSGWIHLLQESNAN